MIDPEVPPVPLGDPRSVPLDRLRVAMYVDDGYFPAAPAIRRAVTEAAGALRSTGVVVESFTPPDVPRAMRLFFGLLSGDGGAWARRALGRDQTDRRIGGLLQLTAIPGVLRAPLAGVARSLRQRRAAEMVLAVRGRSTDDYWQLVEERNRYRARFLAKLDAGRFDAIICPPHALPALTHGSSYYLSSAASYAMLYNLLGMPAGVVAATRVRVGGRATAPRAETSSSEPRGTSNAGVLACRLACRLSLVTGAKTSCWQSWPPSRSIFGASPTTPRAPRCDEET